MRKYQNFSEGFKSTDILRISKLFLKYRYAKISQPSQILKSKAVAPKIPQKNPVGTPSLLCSARPPDFPRGGKTSKIDF